VAPCQQTALHALALARACASRPPTDRAGGRIWNHARRRSSRRARGAPQRRRERLRRRLTGPGNEADQQQGTGAPASPFPRRPCRAEHVERDSCIPCTSRPFRGVASSGLECRIWSRIASLGGAGSLSLHPVNSCGEVVDMGSRKFSRSHQRRLRQRHPNTPRMESHQRAYYVSSASVWTRIPAVERCFRTSERTRS